MKILLIDGAPFFGGQARHVSDLAKGLSSLGHEAVVACRHPQLEEALRHCGLSCHRLPFRVGCDPQSIAALYGIIKNSGFNIVHTHGVRAGLVGRLAGRLSGEPRLVHTVHTMAQDLVRDKGLLGGVQKQVYCRTEAWLASFTDRIITVSDDLKRRSIENGIAGRKIVTVHSGVDLSDYEQLENKNHARGRIGVPVGCKLVGTIARFTPQKNLGDFLEAARIISKQIDNVMFALVGDGPETDALRLQAQALGISHRTVFTGFHRDIAKILPGFDVFMLSSKWEGHPLSVLEAMAAGLPVVANSVTGVNETVIQGRTGYVVRTGDVEALASATINLLEDPSAAAEMGAIGRDRAVGLFGLERMIREIEQVYVSVVERNVSRQTAEVF